MEVREMHSRFFNASFPIRHFFEIFAFTIAIIVSVASKADVCTSWTYGSSDDGTDIYYCNGNSNFIFGYGTGPSTATFANGVITVTATSTDQDFSPLPFLTFYNADTAGFVSATIQVSSAGGY